MTRRLLLVILTNRCRGLAHGRKHFDATRYAALERDVAELIVKLPGSRFAVTVTVARCIRSAGYRFDASWRHGATDEKAAAYARCCTFAANDIADDPTMAAFWKEYLTDAQLHPAQDRS